MHLFVHLTSAPLNKRQNIFQTPGRPLSADTAASQECVGNVTRYPDVARGTRRKSSDVADAVHQPVVTQIG